MKEKIIDNIVRGVVFLALAWIGLRGIVPDAVAAGGLPMLLLAAVASIVGFAVGPYAYQKYRCAKQCEPTCEPSFCRA
jgi:hypothetical protein